MATEPATDKRGVWTVVEELIEKHQSAAGLAQLARLVRDEPESTAPANRLLSLLTDRPFALPAGELMQGGEILTAAYSDDGPVLSTAAYVGARSFAD